MATIDSLVEATIVGDEDLLLIDQGGEGKKLKKGNLKIDASNVPNSDGGSVQDFIDFSKTEFQGAIKKDNNAVSRMYSNVMIIGDSITEGVGATTYTDSYVYKFGRSFFNNQNNGASNDEGLMYETNANMLKAWSEVGMPSAGGGGSSGISFVNTGLTDKQLLLPAGEYFYFKTREVAKVGFFYDGATTTATTALVSLNGTVVGTLTLGGTTKGSHSGFVTMPFSKNTEISDEIRITSTDGDLYISGLTSHRLSSVGGGLYIVPRGGWTFDDFNTTEKLDELAAMLNFNKSSSSRRLVILALGTNSIYQEGGRAQTPDDYIVSLNSLIQNITTRATNTTFVLTVPPRANPAFFNIKIGSGYTYEDYRDAILSYAKQNGLSVIRYDQTLLSESPYQYYDDGLHPNSAGHSIYVAKLCDFLQISYNNYVKTIDFKELLINRFEIPVADFPGSGGAPTIKWVDLQKKVNRILSVRLRTQSGLEVQAEAVRDESDSTGIFWHNQGSNAVRFFYQNSKGFARNTGYYAVTGLLLSSSTGVTLVVDYI